MNTQQPSAARQARSRFVRPALDTGKCDNICIATHAVLHAAHKVFLSVSETYGLVLVRMIRRAIHDGQTNSSLFPELFHEMGKRLDMCKALDLAVDSFLLYRTYRWAEPQAWLNSSVPRFPGIHVVNGQPPARPAEQAA